IVERERAIRAFTPVTYFTVEADIEARDGERAIFALPKTRLEKINGKPIGKPGILSDTDADAIVADLKNDAKLSWKDIERRDVRRSSAPPFTTSAMQQEAARRLGFSAAFTMRVAQSLYEEGYITYMRTDSVNLSQESLAAARAWIEKQLGSRYAAEAPRVFRTKSRLAQEAHEAIRPTNPSLSPETVPADQNGKRLYELIWQRFMASQLPHAIFEATRLDIEARGTSGAAYTLRATGTRLVFDGFLRLYPTQFEENELPRVLGTEAIALVDARSLRHETQPLPRFNDASLIKALEENGIGRPSTYAPTIAVLEERRYTTREQDRRFHPTEIGEMVTDLLTEHFPEIADIQFTAALEEKLDRIADGKDAWNEVIRNFYLPFEKRLTEKYEEVTKRATSEKTDEACEKCGKPMLIRLGRFGRFMACSGFPECKNTKPLPSGEDEANGAENGSGAIPCPQCGEGQVTRKRTKRGRFFYGCTRYPECDFASWKKVEPAHAPPRE
ncbi:MAG: type I DNA topoisomerase, partial [Candidatus Colwellbacteria bacterium]|nr:type I DNA topoisomerase [Candidatus Colwellbacteria bacterium]